MLAVPGGSQLVPTSSFPLGSSILYCVPEIVLCDHCKVTLCPAWPWKGKSAFWPGVPSVIVRGEPLTTKGGLVRSGGTSYRCSVVCPYASPGGPTTTWYVPAETVCTSMKSHELRSSALVP